MNRTIIFLPIFLIAITYLVFNLNRFIKILKLAESEDCTNNPKARLLKTLKVAFAQSKILRDKFGGLSHVAIFWGFLVLLFSATEAIIQGLYSEFSWNFLGGLYSFISLSTDVFSIFILFGIIIAIIRRFVMKVPRLQGDKSETKDALFVLSAIFIIVSSLIVNSISAYQLHLHSNSFQPFAKLLSGLISPDNASSIYEVSWWIHILTILAFMNYLPFSKHFHVFTAIPNVYFSTIGTNNKLERIDFEREGIEKFGVTDFEDLSWRTVHSAYSCTHCGRCSAVCPATTTGKELSPREIMIQIRNRAEEKGGLIVDKKGNIDDSDTTAKAILDKRLIGDYESERAIWQCTTCGACMQECPISIEHIPAIIGMRRSQVMMTAEFPSELQAMFDNIENNYAPWAFSPQDRANWAEGLDVKTCADNPEFDVLYWVGCAGSFDDNAKRTTVAFAKLMQKAGISFAILGEEERCNGDIARRAGNEYLADTMIKMNIETLQQYNVKKIVTACPHCFNTFKNEYPDFGFKAEVVHHSEFILQLIKDNKLEISDKLDLNLSYHDSCYLGRYNNIYSAPREVINSVNNSSVSEVNRTKDRSFCCGAGAAQMFMEETDGKRINIERTEELLATNCNTIAVNCPFCMTMINDGVKTLEKSESVKVRDIAEIVLDALK